MTHEFWNFRRGRALKVDVLHASKKHIRAFAGLQNIDELLRR